MDNKVLMIEFNELCLPLLEKYMAEGILPNFKKLYEMGNALVTQADAEPPHLNPWTQWVTVHTGVPFSEHQVKRLTDGPLCNKQDIWGYLASKGMRVGNFSSMNSKSFDYQDSFFFPDPWTQTEKAFPSELTPLNNFISQNVQKHASDSEVKSSAIEFIKFYLLHGFNVKTIWNIIKQLLREKLYAKQSWRRAFVLDWVCKDVFLNLLATKRPHFATFFTNSTAHMQHAYWRQHDPDAFELKPTEAEIKAYGSAIKDAYINHDKMLGDFLEMRKKHGYEIALLSALSQQPFTNYDNDGGQHFYRLHDAEAFIHSLGFAPKEVLPTMTHQFRIRFEEKGEANRLQESLTSIKQSDSDRSLFYCHVDNDFEVYFACAVTSPIDLTRQIKVEGDNVTLHKLLYKIEGTKSGRHHPDGIAWFTWPVSKMNGKKLELMDIVPTICEKLEVPIMSQSIEPKLKTA